MKRIFYFNTTYGCDSNCVFCYSHNTRHNSKSHNEISAAAFFEYLDNYGLTSGDRVIVNGGEPFLHSEIDTILSGLAGYGCEVLIYTNGRTLAQHDLSKLPERYRLVIPIHGPEDIHDSITGVKGSYQETLMGLQSLAETTSCLVDIKLIINAAMLSGDHDGAKLFESLSRVPFNNAVHITKMADTIVSKRNGYQSVSNEDAAYYTALLYNYFKDRNREIKVFDTCVKDIGFDGSQDYKPYGELIMVFFKDWSQFRIMDLTRTRQECMDSCKCLEKCASAVDEYKVLVYSQGIIFEDLE